MTSLENIQDIVTIKEVMDKALNNLYEGKPFSTTEYLFGKTIFVFIENGLQTKEVTVSSKELDYAYTLDNSNSTQSQIIDALLK